MVEECIELESNIRYGEDPVKVANELVDEFLQEIDDLLLELDK